MISIYRIGGLSVGTRDGVSPVFWVQNCRINPNRELPTPWKINMEHNHRGLVQIIFLSKWVICMFHVNLPGCRPFRTLEVQRIYLMSDPKSCNSQEIFTRIFPVKRRSCV